MTRIHYVLGDATKPSLHGHDGVVIAHVCNNVGAWGAGFVVPLAEAFPLSELEYHRWRHDWMTSGLGQPFQLGEIQFVWGNDNVRVLNMIAQDHLPTRTRRMALSYGALRRTLLAGARAMAEFDAAMVMPRIGCGIAGGDWEKVEEIIVDTVCDLHGVPVYVYDLPKK